MSTPTPRTDDVYLEHRYWANEDEATEAIEDLRDLARKLERELATERAKVRTLREALATIRNSSDACGCVSVCHCNDNVDSLKVWKDDAVTYAKVTLAATKEGAK